MKKISDVYSIPQNEILIIRRNPMLQSHLSELVNRDDSLLEKNLYYHKIFNGLQLFIERKSEDWKIGQQTKWDKEFENDKYKCVISFNDPRKTKPDQAPDYDL
jgi:hypothetical protein